MLEVARREVPAASFTSELPESTFDLIVSLIVLQHVPVTRGLELMRELLLRLAMGGVAALEFAVTREGGGFRRLARAIRARSRLLHTIASHVEGDHRGLPYMQMNAYDMSTVRSEIEAAGCVVRHVEPTDHGGIRGAIVIARKV